MSIKLIAHRGNICGANPHKENSPRYLGHALREGFDVEIDLWKIDDQLWLGHDQPVYQVSYQDLRPMLNRGWFHCKNRSALEYCLRNNFHCFEHEDQPFAITNQMWWINHCNVATPVIGPQSVLVSFYPPHPDILRQDIGGLITDWPTYCRAPHDC